MGWWQKKRGEKYVAGGFRNMTETFQVGAGFTESLVPGGSLAFITRIRVWQISSSWMQPGRMFFIFPSSKMSWLPSFVVSGFFSLKTNFHLSSPVKLSFFFFLPRRLPGNENVCLTDSPFALCVLFLARGMEERRVVSVC